MPRRGAVPKREIKADPRYENVMVAQFINKLMMKGKKSLARRIFYDCCDIIAHIGGEASPSRWSYLSGAGGGT